MSLSFVIKTAVRDARPAWRRLVFVAASVVLGVAALVAVGSFGRNLQAALDSQARGLLGADLEVSSRGALSPEGRAVLASLGGEQSTEKAFASMLVFPGRGGAADRSRLVTVRAIDGAYPFYGDFVTGPAGARSMLGAENNVILEETLLRQFGVAVGDEVRLGRGSYRVVGALRQIPGESAAVALLSPRVLVGQAAIEEAGLMGPGSIVRNRTYFKFPDGTDVEALVAANRARLRAERLSYDTVAERRRELGDTMDNLNAFLALTGFVALFLGAVGVASALRVYLRGKRSTVAVLRCLGASGREAFGVFLVQGAALGVVGSIVGAAVGIGVQRVLPGLLADFLPVDVRLAVAWGEVGRGVLIGVVLTLLFSLLPLLAVRRVSPLSALRAAAIDVGGGRDPWRWFIGAGIAVAVTGFAIWQTGSWRLGLGFAGGLAAGLGVLAGLARLVIAVTRRLRLSAAPYVVRQGVANLHRPNNRTTLLVLALGAGTALLLTLFLTRATLLGQLRGVGSEGRPDLLFFDVQDDQVDGLRYLLHAQGTPPLAEAPIVTMRLRSLRGRAVDDILRDRSSDIPSWTLRREYRSTYRDRLSDTEKLVAGEWIPSVADPDAVVPVSVERGLAKDLRIGLGDEMVFDVQGVPMRVRVASLREVEWRRLSPNFFVVFPRGVLEPAPKFHVVAARAAEGERSARVQQAVVAAYPNVSVIDLSLVIATLDRIFGKAELAVRFMAMFTLATGVVVMAGALASGRRQRIRETVLLRTLGATSGQLAGIQLVEYAVLGALAAITGALLAAGANAALAFFVFKTAAASPWLAIGVAVPAVSAVTLVTGALAGRGVTRHPPLAVLRQAGE